MEGFGRGEVGGLREWEWDGTEGWRGLGGETLGD